MSVLHRKMIVGLLRTWAVLFLALGLGKAEVTLENGAYRNLLVSFSPNLKSTDGADLLHSMKELLENTSRALHTALGVRIADVTILLPDSWTGDDLKLDPAPEIGKLPVSLEDSDVLVQNVQDDPFGKAPLAMQFGGCGVPGARINVPQDFLKASEDYPKGKLLAREFLKYRYGVFDENGFPGDARYPTFYSIPGMEDEIQVTDCTHEQVEYTFKDSNGNNCSLSKSSVDTCKIHPGEMSTENVTSSLMYFHEELPNVNHVCGKDHPHNVLSPSKQNILCSEKSIWDVLEQSSDFKNLPDATEEYAETVFRFVHERKPRVALLFEDTNLLSGKGNELLFAMRRFVYELPEGSQLSIHSFSGEDFETDVRELSELTGTRGNIIPDVKFQVPPEGVCPLCTLEKAVDGLLTEDNKDGTILLIVGSKSEREDISALVKVMKESQLCLKVIALKEVGDTYDKLLSELKCQALEQVPDSENRPETFVALYNAMTDVLPRTYTDSPVEVVASEELSKEKAIVIAANPSAAEFAIWFQGSVPRNLFTCLTEDSAAVEVKLVEPISLISRYSFPSPNKEVKCGWRYQTTDTVTLTQVQMRRKAGHFVSGSAWIHNPTPAGDDLQMPIVIYAKVSYGDYPVSDAAVKGTVTDSEGNIVAQFDLHDNGKGDPDITRNDGIYSRYFFNFTKEGVYSVSIEINDNAGIARALKKGADHCCGSEVKANEKLEVPAFSTTAETSFEAVSSRPEKGYPPSRIIDLRVERYEPPTLLELKWTAPGGEVDTGRASRYVFSLFCDEGNATYCTPDGKLPGWISFNHSLPKEAGREDTVRFLMSDGAPWNATVRFGLESIRWYMTGGLSNTVQVRLVEAEVVEEKEKKKPDDQDDDRTVQVGAIVGGTVVGILVLFCIIGAVYFAVSSARRPKHEKKGPLDTLCTDRSDSFRAGRPPATQMRRVESFPVVLYTHDQIKDVKDKTKVKEPPLFRADVSPKPWLSLGELPRGGIGGLVKGAEGSGSTTTIPVGEVGAEMQQVNEAVSLDSELDGVGKVAKF